MSSTNNNDNNDDQLNPVSPRPTVVQSEDAPGNEHPHRFTIWKALRSVQRYSSYSFSAFLTMHAASVIAAPVISVEAGDATMNFTKAVYQEALLEPALVYIPLSLHIASGAILRFHKNYLHRKHYGGWPSLHKVWNSMSSISKTGIALTPLVIGHVYSMRVAPLNVLGDSSAISLEYMAHWIHTHPYFIWSVYPVMVSIAMYHSIMGFRKWFNIKQNLNAVIATLSLCGLVSLVNISRVPHVTGYLLKQYNQVLLEM